MTTESQLNVALKDLWRNRGSNDYLDAAKRICSAALAAPTGDALLATRCLTAMDNLPPSSPAFAARIHEFRNHTAQLILRAHQVDQIGDINTEPEALFGIFGDELQDYDISKFNPDSLRSSRIHLKHRRYDAAVALLSEFGHGNLPAETVQALQQAADHLRQRAEAHQATALFTAPDGAGIALGVRASKQSGNAIVGYNAADTDMRIQSEAVLRQEYDAGAGWDIEWELGYGGSSIGLALLVAARVDKGEVLPDPLLACTGKISVGSVQGVGGIPAKVQAAAAAGYRRILVPSQNEDEAREAARVFPSLTVYTIEKTDDLLNVLANISGAVPVGIAGTSLFIRKLLPLYQLDLVGEPPLKNGRRLEVTNSQGCANIDIYSGRKGTVALSGKPGPALDSAQQLVDERLSGSRIQQRAAVTCTLAVEARQARLRRELEQAGAVENSTSNPYEKWRYTLEEGHSKAVVTCYTTGKVSVNAGYAPAHDTITEALNRALAGIGSLPVTVETAPHKPTPAAAVTEAEYVPHIGTDEAGKGDYFGPLVCAACYVDASAAQQLRDLGVQDSKKLSDKRIRVLADGIRDVLPGNWKVVTIQPRRYNELMEEFRAEKKNLNSLVAWGHARGIKDLIIDHRDKIDHVVIDKFADERYILEHLRSDSRASDLNLDLRVRGESDIAVAAASILARDMFVKWLEKRAEQVGLPLPKGAGEQVIEAAQAIVARDGADALKDLAKLSFKTTQRVLGESA